MEVYKVLSRIYVQDIAEAVNFYEKILDTKTNTRFAIPQMNIELAQIGDVLLISGSKEDLIPFIETKATFLVDSVNEFREYLIEHGATIIREPKEVPTGVNMTVRHPDGTVIEYVEHK